MEIVDVSRTTSISPSLVVQDFGILLVAFTSLSAYFFLSSMNATRGMIMQKCFFFGLSKAVKKLLLITFLLAPFAATSQPRTPMADTQNMISPVLFESVSLLGPDSAKCVVNIHYRIPRSYFIFVKQRSSGKAKEEFGARGQLVIELINEQHASVAREIRPIALRRTSLPGPTEQLGDLDGAAVFTLAKGEYQIVLEVDDLESGRNFLDKKHTVKARSAAPISIDLSTTFFASLDTTEPSSPRYVAFNHGMNVLFGGRRGGLVGQLYCPQSDSTPQVGWTLHGEAEDRTELVRDRSGTDRSVVNGLLDLAVKEGPVVYTVKPAQPSWTILYVPIPLEQLEPGRYTLAFTINSGKEKIDQRVEFQVVWPSRPRSLMDWDIATDALRFIATPKEMDEILNTSSAEGAQAFHRFWRKKDPDTTTVYNEMMVEYYRRVDETIRRYSTSRENDGYKTDRGRIFILFGPPTTIDRSLLPDEPPKEIWTYQSIGKQFVFIERNKTGNYILTETNDL